MKLFAPIVLLCCYACAQPTSICAIESLCTAHHGFTHNNLTTLFTTQSFHPNNGGADVCFTNRDDGAYTCSLATSDGRLTFPSSVVGLVDFDFMQQTRGAGNASTQKCSYFVSPLEAERSYHGSHVHILHPPYGSIVSNGLEIRLSVTSATPLQSLYFDAAGLLQVHLDPESEVIGSGDMAIQPGSIFYTLYTVPAAAAAVDGTGGSGVDGGYALSGYPALGYIEYVQSDTEIRNSRRYSQHRNERRTTRSAALSTANKIGAPTNICIFSGPKLDGQKQIWATQSASMDPSKFHFTWLVHIEDSALHNTRASINPVVRSLANMTHISIAANPNFALNANMLNQDPHDGRLPASAVYDGNTATLFRYAHDSLLFYHSIIDEIQPLWCRQYYQLMRDTLQTQRCDIVVYGNKGSFGSDVLIVDTARVLGIPTVGELLNLNLHKDMLPTAVVAPSSFVMLHDSVQSVLRAAGVGIGSTSVQQRSTSVAVVIPPSVDTAKFDPAKYSDSTGAVYRHPVCTVTGDVLSKEHTHFPCFVVGFLARQSPEKNPGLFLQAAYKILQLHPFARFTVVGDGPLRAPLEDLAARLRISWAVHFAGWVSSEHLPHLLAGMDVVVNSGLVLETFCISNIEVMSMEVPLVTFAVGGIGEYVQDPQAIAGVNGSLPDYTVSNNAVVLNRATPLAIAGAVQHLILHPALRKSIGRAGRETVLSYFIVQRQVDQYANLYTSLLSI